MNILMDQINRARRIYRIKRVIHKVLLCSRNIIFGLILIFLTLFFVLNEIVAFSMPMLVNKDNKAYIEEIEILFKGLEDPFASKSPVDSPVQEEVLVKIEEPSNYSNPGRLNDSRPVYILDSEPEVIPQPKQEFSSLLPVYHVMNPVQTAAKSFPEYRVKGIISGDDESFAIIGHSVLEVGQDLPLGGRLVKIEKSSVSIDFEGRIYNVNVEGHGVNN